MRAQSTNSQIKRRKFSIHIIGPFLPLGTCCNDGDEGGVERDVCYSNQGLAAPILLYYISRLNTSNSQRLSFFEDCNHFYSYE